MHHEMRENILAGGEDRSEGYKPQRRKIDTQHCMGEFKEDCSILCFEAFIPHGLEELLSAHCTSGKACCLRVHVDPSLMTRRIPL